MLRLLELRKPCYNPLLRLLLLIEGGYLLVLITVEIRFGWLLLRCSCPATSSFTSSKLRARQSAKAWHLPTQNEFRVEGGFHFLHFALISAYV